MLGFKPCSCNNTLVIYNKSHSEPKHGRPRHLQNTQQPKAQRMEDGAKFPERKSVIQCMQKKNHEKPPNKFPKKSQDLLNLKFGLNVFWVYNLSSMHSNCPL